MTTSQSRSTPRATASTGSKLRDRSSQATTEPSACASATTRRLSVVRPLVPAPADRDAGRLREAAGAEDRVECREPGPDDAVVGPRVVSWGLVGLRRSGRQGQGADDARSCGTPAGPEARDGGVHITPTGRHETPRIERMF